MVVKKHNGVLEPCGVVLIVAVGLQVNVNVNGGRSGDMVVQVVGSH